MPIIFLFAFVLLYAAGFGQKPVVQKPIPPIAENKGHLVYGPDSLGNRVVDFSYCGYKASDEKIPDVPVKIVVPLTKEEATLRIQTAIDYVASLPLVNGFRGAVLLQKGVYSITGQLKITTSGVVVRGSGMGQNGTILQGAGTDRETLIRIAGINDKVVEPGIAVNDRYVPVNANKVSITSAANLKVGDNVLVKRPSTKKWISVLGTETFGGGISALGWKPGERDIFWDRKIIGIDGNTVTLDAPLTTALDTTYGGATLALYNWSGRISNIGVENLSCVSTYDTSNPKDEAHRWMAITMENVMDGWVRQVNFKHFAGSAVYVMETARRITVEDCKSLEPISEIGGYRRNTFFTTGQQTLFQRCYAEKGSMILLPGFVLPDPMHSFNVSQYYLIVSAEP